MHYIIFFYGTFWRKWAIIGMNVIRRRNTMKLEIKYKKDKRDKDAYESDARVRSVCR